MKIYAGQIYIQPEATFCFSVAFQKWLGDELSKLVTPSDFFLKKYGSDFNLIFRISAKAELANTEIRGPTVFRKARDVEFSIFLPFRTIQQQPQPTRAALVFLMNGVIEVLTRLGISTALVEEKRHAMIDRAATDPGMLDQHRGCRP